MGKLKQGTRLLQISTNEYPDFADRLKIAMLVRNCSTEELASTSFLTPSAIYGYRAGLRSPNVEILRILAKNLNVSADFLLGLQEEISI